MMKNCLTLLLLILALSVCEAQTANDNISVSRIWSEGEHNAFGDIIRFRGSFYCAFRQGKSHVGPENSGMVRIIKSRDGIKWEPASLLGVDGVDLRDPKLSVSSDDKIMVIMAGAVFKDGMASELYPMVSFSDKAGKRFSEPQRPSLDAEIEPSRDWLWRVTWHKGTGYAIDYQLKENSRNRSALGKNAWVLYLMKTKDGKAFEKLARLDVEDLPNEATVRFDENDRMYALIRREAGDRQGVLGVSAPPYTGWEYSKLDFRLGGPNFLFLNDDKLVMGTRIYGEQTRTGVLVTDLKGSVLKTITLPSGGDTSYPGMLFYKNELWVVYYSSHEGKSQIYLAKIPLRELEV
jgi:hypothetical protein